MAPRLYRMAQPMLRQGTRNVYYVRRIPKDCHDAAVKLGHIQVPIGGVAVPITITPSTQSIRVSLRSADPQTVRDRTKAVDACLDLQWQALRQAEPIALTHKQAVALAGEVFRAWNGEYVSAPPLLRKTPRPAEWRLSPEARCRCRTHRTSRKAGAITQGDADRAGGCVVAGSQGGRAIDLDL